MCRLCGELSDVLGGKKFTARVIISSTANTCTIDSNSTPNHDFNKGSQAFRNSTKEVSGAFTFVRNPAAPSGGRNTALTLAYDYAIFLNGVKLNLLSAGCFGIGDGKIGCSDSNSNGYRYDSMHSGKDFGADQYNAHTQPDGAYHYHGNPSPLFSQKVSPVIGFAADGYPSEGFISMMVPASKKLALAIA